MAVKRTVFVLGAGASKPFGLPTGEELRADILDLCKRFHIEISQAFGKAQTGFAEPEHVTLFHERFLRSGARSIDAFLEENVQFQSLGKFLIAAAILPNEWEAIAKDAICGDWFSWLFGSISNPRALIANGDLAFITFNYDRLLEVAIYQHLRYQRQVAAHEAGEFAKTCPIHHVYGMLSIPLDRWFNDGIRECKGNIVEYFAYCWAASQGIQLGGGRADDAKNESLMHCKMLIEAADNVVCLGFGFDRINMERIGLRGVTDGVQAKRVVASAYGLEEGEVAVARRLLGEKWPVSLGAKDQDCILTLRAKCVQWLTDVYRRV